MRVKWLTNLKQLDKLQIRITEKTNFLTVIPVMPTFVPLALLRRVFCWADLETMVALQRRA